MSKKPGTKKASKPSHVVFDMGVLDPAVLSHDEVGLENAIGILEGHFQNTAVDIEALLKELLSVPGRFEFVFSNLGEAIAQNLTQKIDSMFPGQAESFENSIVCQMLSSIEQYFWQLEYPAAHLQEHHQFTQRTRAVLKAISNMVLVDSPAIDIKDEDLDSLARRQHTNQRDRKKGRRVPQSTGLTLDTKHFEQLGEDTPSHTAEAAALASKLLSKQKDILKYYFEVLRRTDLAPLYKKTYFYDRAGGVNAERAEATAIVGTTSTDTNPPQTLVPPSAYPQIQPMKAALHFKSVKGFGEWMILISSRAEGDLRTAKKRDQKSFSIILKKIKELSNGHFSDDNQKRLTGAGTDVPIFEAKMTKDLRLVYQVDCVKDLETELEHQVLRLFGIFTHANLDQRLWDYVGQHLSGKGREYRKRCNYRMKPRTAGNDVFSPMTFAPNTNPETSVTSTELNVLDLSDKITDELHSVLALEKFVAFSQAVLYCIMVDQDVAHDFQLSPLEQEIVKYRASCYVIGRSGTGKTTTMMDKMLRTQRQYDRLIEDGRTDVLPPRQMFVTQSKILAGKVEEYFAKRMASYCAGQRSIKKAVEVAARQQAQRDLGMIVREEEEVFHNTLPQGFKYLNDDHFPLFLTYDDLCRLLEHDFLEDHGMGAISSSNDGRSIARLPSAPGSRELERQKSFVSFQVFRTDYWHHLPQYLTKSLEPAMVFAEFMGVIRGSEQTLTSQNGCLDRDQYVALNHRQYSTFSSQRETVYALFEAYVRLKRGRREWDVADRAHNILRGLRTLGFPGRKLDYIYVDEVQDNLLIDALVLRRACSTASGLFWAGDTAQTISAESSFKFDGLKAFLYDIETHNFESPIHPRTFQLTTNYRSHGGIVKAANFIIRLIARFWPNAIDFLSDEKGIVDGIKPIFFSNWDQAMIEYRDRSGSVQPSHKATSNKSARETSTLRSEAQPIEFGATQCVIVRDEAARKKLRKEMGDIGLVFTLYESKGQEFNDVLIYNFFEDSTLDVAQWRVVLNALPENTLAKCPEFDEIRHGGICLELKSLYVALTRARKNLWIADCSEKGEPLRMLWTAYDLIRSQMATPEDVLQLTKDSTEEEWATTGRKLFEDKRFAQAARCFERASMKREAEIASAYSLRELAQSLPATSRALTQRKNIAYKNAADAFHTSAASSKLPKEQQAFYRIAAGCYKTASEDIKAARTYILARDFNQAAKIFRSVGSFDAAVDVVKRHRDQMDANIVENIRAVAGMHYFKHKRLDAAMKLFTVEEALTFTEEYGFNFARVSLLEANKRYVEAAATYIEDGNTLQGLKVLMEDLSDPESLRLAGVYVSKGIWEHLSFGIVHPASASAEFISLATSLEQRGVLTGIALDELHMIRAINEDKPAILRQLGERFIEVHANAAASLLCFDHAFSKPLMIQQMNAGADKLYSALQEFLPYCRVLQRVAHDLDAQDGSMQSLFGFRPAPDIENSFEVIPHTFLHSQLSQTQKKMSTQDGPCILRYADLMKCLKDALHGRLKDRVYAETSACQKAPALNVCTAQAVFGSCYRGNCMRAHVEADIVSAQTLVAIILQQVQIYQTIIPIEENKQKALRERRSWLSRLYHTLFPEHHKAGSLCDIDFTSIPGSSKGLQVIKEWVRDVLYSSSALDELDDRQYFLTDAAEIITLATILERDTSFKIVSQAPFVCKETPPQDLVRGNESIYILTDLIDHLHGTTEHATTLGIIFLNEIVSKGLTLDINVLCNMFERVCALLVASLLLGRNDSLHGMTLSRKWIIKVHENIDVLRTQQVDFGLQMLHSLVPALVQQMHSGSRLLYQRNRNIDNRIRSICISRIYQSTVLVGYNINNRELRTSILKSITYWKESDMLRSDVLRRYIEAKNHQDLVRAFRYYGRKQKGTWEELTFIQDASKVKIVRPISGVNRVLYRRHEDIPGLVRGARPSNLRPDAPQFIPTPVQDLAADQPSNEDTVDHGFELDDDSEEVHLELSHNVDVTTQMVDSGRQNHTFEPPTERELHAAKVFIRCCRRLIQRKAARKGLAEARERHYMACREHLHDTMEEKYRVLFLGPLPHAHVCIERILAEASLAKTAATKRAQTEQDTAYEDIMAEIDVAINIKKQAHDFKKSLAPDSDIHKASLAGKLAAVVETLQTWVHGLPKRYTTKIGEDLGIAVKGIVQQPRTKEKALKSDLVFDNYEDWYMSV